MRVRRLGRVERVRAARQVGVERDFRLLRGGDTAVGVNTARLY